MKILFLIPAVAMILLSNSCRTFKPLDPMTMRPSERCLPYATPSEEIKATK